LAQQPADPRYGWTIVAVLAVTETVSWGVLYYAFAVFLLPMQHDLGWSKAELTGAFSVALGTSAVAAFPIGRWLDRSSPRPLMTLGSLGGALLVLAWSQVDDLFLFYLIWVGIGLAMACVLYEAAFTVVTKWFRARRRQALTTVTLVGGLASFVFSPLSNWLIDNQGWRDALITLAIMLAVTTVPLHGLFLQPAPKRERHEAPPLVPDNPPTQVTPQDVPTHAAVSTSGFWYLTAAFVLSSFAISAVAVHLIPYLIEGGRSASFAAAAAGLLGLMQVPAGSSSRAWAGTAVPLRSS
jgi:MFS family permease